MNMNELQEQLKLQEQMTQIEQEAKQILDRDALTRYGTLKAAYPERAFQIAMLLRQMIHKKQLSHPLTDIEFKQLLTELQEKPKEFRLTRK